MCCSFGLGSFSFTVSGVEVFSGGEFKKTTGEQWFSIDSSGNAVSISPPTASPTKAPTTQAPVPPSNPSPGNGPSHQVVPGLQPSCSIIDGTKFNICLDLKASSAVHADWGNSFGKAKATWERIISGDNGSSSWVDPASLGDLVATALPPLIDDLYIAIKAKSIDGTGGILGMAGPTRAQIKNGRFMPITGMMEFDVADINDNIARNLFESIILHEMGHVLGIGTMWSIPSQALYDGTTYTGTHANAEFQAISGLTTRTVPIEKDGGPGTAGGHWDEECMPKELMTGYLDQDMKMSRITLGGLQDLGYTVDMSQADPFDIDPSDCVNSRRLRSKHSRWQRDGVRQLAGTRQILSVDGESLARSYGESVIEHNKEIGRHVELPSDIMDVSGSNFSVIYMEGGAIFEVDV